MALAAAALLVSGMVGVLAFAGPASAAAAVTVTPSTGLSNGSVVVVTGTGFDASDSGAILECNNTPGQPTVSVLGIEDAPVGCSGALNKIVSTDASGNTPPTNFTVTTGTVGPPYAGTDTNGNPAATDAALYPCPPTAAQASDGYSCVIALGTQNGPQVQVPISFSGGSTTTTTTSGGSTTTTTSGGGTTPTTTTHATTTTTHATTTTSSTTTTTIPCDSKSTTVPGPPSMTMDPGTCLNGGTVVKVTGSGFDPKSSGSILQCNSDTGQPTVALPAPVSQNVPVSCTGISTVVTTGTDGTFSGSFTIIYGVSGPPCGKAIYPLTTTCPAADSAGIDPATDAAKYPCPPTAAQIAAGDNCTLSFGDAAGAQQSVPISYTPNATATGGGSGTTTTTAAGGAAATSASSTGAATAAKAPTATATSLAFTGAGPGTWYTLLGGLLLLDLGFLILTLYYRPREMAAMFSRGLHKTFGGK